MQRVHQQPNVWDITRSRAKRMTGRLIIALVTGLLTAVVLTQSAYAYGCQYAFGDYPSPVGTGNYFFAQVNTGSCTKPGHCGYAYQYTEGLKGNLSRGGTINFNGYTNQNVSEWLMAAEDTGDNHTCQDGTSKLNGNATCCLAINQCTAQVGWQAGYSLAPSFPNCNAACQAPCKVISSGQTAVVYVEIFDDSTMPCFRTSFGTAPSNASYDVRYYGTASGLYRYNVYYEVPGSGNIQLLAYGDYRKQHTAAVSATEVYVGPPTSGSDPLCPIMTNPPLEWDYHGLPASQSTFADHMNVYTGSWQPWTTAAAPTILYENDKPYELIPVSNFTGDFTEWKSGGPHDP